MMKNLDRRQLKDTCFRRRNRTIVWVWHWGKFDAKKSQKGLAPRTTKKSPNIDSSCIGRVRCNFDKANNDTSPTSVPDALNHDHQSVFSKMISSIHSAALFWKRTVLSGKQKLNFYRREIRKSSQDLWRTLRRRPFPCRSNSAMF